MPDPTDMPPRALDDIGPATRGRAVGVGLLLVVGVFLVQSIAAGIGVVFALMVFDVPDSDKLVSTATDAGLALVAWSELMLAAVLVLLAVRIGRRTTGLVFGSEAWRSLRLATPVLLVMVGLPLVGLILTGEPIVDAGLNASRVVLIAVVVVGVGIAEEIAFRGVLIPVLGGSSRPAFAAIASALLFGVVHLAVPDASAAYYVNALAVMLAVGIPFAVIRLRTGNIIGLVIVHALIDLFALLYIGSLELPSATLGQALVELGMSVVLAAAYWVWFKSGLVTTTVDAQG